MDKEVIHIYASLYKKKEMEELTTAQGFPDETGGGGGGGGVWGRIKEVHIPRNEYKKVTFIHSYMKNDPGIVLGAKVWQ